MREMKHSVLNRVTGFTLLEMSIVLVIIAVIAGGGATIFSASLQKQQLDETKQKLQVIQKALLDYRRAFNRIPCPARADILISAQYFGQETANPGTCMGGVPAANFSSGENVQGMVPTKTLGLPDEYALDGWGRRIFYAVDRRATTATTAFTTIAISDTTTRFTVKDASGTSITTKAIYVLLSAGLNGHGAYQRNGAARINAGSTNTDEQDNCDCDDEAVATGLDGIFIQKLPTQDASDATVRNNFDDIVVYGLRRDLRSFTE